MHISIPVMALCVLGRDGCCRLLLSEWKRERRLDRASEAPPARLLLVSSFPIWMRKWRRSLGRSKEGHLAFPSSDVPLSNTRIALSTLMCFPSLFQVSRTDKIKMLYRSDPS